MLLSQPQAIRWNWIPWCRRAARKLSSSPGWSQPMTVDPADDPLPETGGGVIRVGGYRACVAEPALPMIEARPLGRAIPSRCPARSHAKPRRNRGKRELAWPGSRLEPRRASGRAAWPGGGSHQPRKSVHGGSAAVLATVPARCRSLRRASRCRGIRCCNPPNTSCPRSADRLSRPPCPSRTFGTTQRRWLCRVRRTRRP